ncbi:MAG: putative metal-binding motif-containing protein, partial [Nanoarchaeota archaeon]|nr:putative metal-binding motif-containing protein [Nanoarchaeota archaeon]
MKAKKEKINYNFAMIAIVAIVAIVALVIIAKVPGREYASQQIAFDSTTESQDVNQLGLAYNNNQGITLSELEQKFNYHYANKVPRYSSGIIKYVNSPYDLEHYLSGFISMYEATQNKSYLDEALYLTENTFARMKDLNGDGYKEWPTGTVSPLAGFNGTKLRFSCLYTVKGARQFARLARVIKNSPDLNPVYGSRADNIIAQIKHDIINDPYCYKRFDKNLYEQELTPVHHVVSHYTMVLLELYLIEGDVTYLNGKSFTYLDTIKAQATALRESMFPQPGNDGSVAWGNTQCTSLDYTYPTCYYVDPSSGNLACRVNRVAHCSPTDVSHAGSFVYVAVELYKAGIVFTKQDIKSIIFTFTKKIWNQDPINPKYNDFIDGNIEPEGGYYYQKYGQAYIMGSNIAPGWAALGAFSNDVQAIIIAGEKSSKTNKATLNYMALYSEIAKNAVTYGCLYTNNAKEINDGLDNDCDGVVDESAACVNGQTQSCGSSACSVSTMTCSSGVWGPCIKTNIAPICPAPNTINCGTTITPTNQCGTCTEKGTKCTTAGTTCNNGQCVE